MKGRLRSLSKYLVVCLCCVLGASVSAQEEPIRSAHQAQLLEMEQQPRVISEDALEARKLASEKKLFPIRPKGVALKSAKPNVSDDFIVFGYLQNEDVVYHIRWDALTHVGCRFVYFDSNGNLTSTSPFVDRSPYLKSGGAAEAAGVKVIAVICSFADGPGEAIEAVMTSSSKRQNLVSQIVSMVDSDGYCQGVSMDLEFSWGSTVRDGITAFMSELRSALDAADPSYELSIYTNAIFSSSQWDFDATTGITPNIDYMIYSMYDWASGNTPHAISDFNSCLGSSKIHAYLIDGLPPEKLVLAISSYSRRWNSTGYNVSGSSPTSGGFTDGLYETTLWSGSGGPFAYNYVEGDEGAWHTWNDGTNRVRTWDSSETMEYKIRHALSLQDPDGNWNGRKIRGVSFWSLYWLAELSSYDQRSGYSVDRTRTYPHIYQLCQEILSPPGTTEFVIDGFEGLDYRWRDPNESPDTIGDTDSNSARALVASPGGAGTPSNSNNAMRVTFDFESSGTNIGIFAHEVLASNLDTTIADIHAMAAKFDATTAVKAYIYTTAAYTNYQIRMLVVDADGELEASESYWLGTTGWRTIDWDLTDPTQIAGFTTSEPGFSSGDGVLDTAGGGARDIGFFGFLIGGVGPLAGNVTIDEVTYRHVNPGGKDYVINEFRYYNSAEEFVEIYGPAGALPTGMQLRVISSSDGSASTYNLSGTIPDEGDGYGYYVVGDSAVENVDYSSGFSYTTNEFPRFDPGGLQLYNSVTGGVYDSVVYLAYGGLGDLVREQTLGVTQNGYPWIGGVAYGTDYSGIDYTVGRYPDGSNTFVNTDDFSFMVSTPGAANGSAVPLGSTFDFSSAPAGAFQTYQMFSVSNPTSAGLPSSSNGGNAHRCVDTSGGGVISAIGDAALGSDGNGYTALGEVYIPSSGQPAQANGIGICGRQGATFFAADSYVDNSGYESGYWLIYENQSGVSLNDGRSDHPGVFEFVHASNDNMDAYPVEILGSATLAQTGVTGGSWSDFELTIDPNASASERLIARINGYTVYSGDIPEGGPTSGAFQIGFRENHTFAPSATEGTWVDNVSLVKAGGTAVGEWSSY